MLRLDKRIKRKKQNISKREEKKRWLKKENQIWSFILYYC